VSNFFSNSFKGINRPQHFFRLGQYLCTAPLTAKSTVDDFFSNSFKGINRPQHFFRLGQYLCTALLTAKSTVDDFLSNSFIGINRPQHFFVRGSTLVQHRSLQKALWTIFFQTRLKVSTAHSIFTRGSTFICHGAAPLFVTAYF